jgi:Zyg-11 family protein
MQRTGMYMLNSLACQLDGQQKLLMGNLGAREKMLALIRERVSSGSLRSVIWA